MKIKNIYIFNLKYFSCRSICYLNNYFHGERNMEKIIVFVFMFVRLKYSIINLRFFFIKIASYMSLLTFLSEMSNELMKSKSFNIKQSILEA